MNCRFLIFFDKPNKSPHPDKYSERGKVPLSIYLLGNRYSPMNAGNMAVGRDIKSSHLSHLGTLRKDIEITIEYHQALYIGNVKPQKEVRIHFYPHIIKSELLPLLL